MNKFFILLISAIISVHIVFAQKNQIERPDGLKLSIPNIDKIVEKLMRKAQIQGLCLTVIADNHPAYIKAYGYKNKPRGEFNDTATCFYGASLSKSVFAYLVMQMVDEGKINLDAPLYTYLPKPLPEYENYKDLAGDDRWKLITARHCLDHTTGFPNWRYFNPHGNKELEIFFTLGDRYAYSGEGIYLLQMVVETITGRNLEDLAREKIFGRFGMRRTSYLWQKYFEDNYAVGHDVKGDTLPKSKRTKANAAGSMETTIADFSRFATCVLQRKNLSSRSREEMFTPQVGINNQHQFPSLNNDTTSENKSIQLSYGLGWGLFNSLFGRCFFKEGHDDGWEHYMINIPDKQYGLIIISNSSTAEGVFKELVEDLTAVEIPWNWEGYIPIQSPIKSH